MPSKNIIDDWQEGLYGPLELQVEAKRGVLYLHDMKKGTTLLRMCRIPSSIAGMLPARKSPLLLDPGDPSEGILRLTTGGGIIVAEFAHVPEYMFSQLDQGFLDITYGYHPVELVPAG